MKEAEDYADKNKLHEVFQIYKSNNIKILEDVRPVDGYDNDLLIGAYMASGDTKYIERILDGYKSMDDEMATIAFRIAMLTWEFGPNLMPKGRETVIFDAVCKKYECKKDTKNIMKVMTLSSGLWAVKSLATKDKGIEKALVEFFKHDARLERLYSIEANDFANYKMMLMVYSAKKDKSISDTLSIYETLGSGKDAFDAFKAAAKSAEEDKPQNSNIAK